MTAFAYRIVCLMLLSVVPTWPSIAGSERSERRAGQDSDELRSDIRQRRLKKVEDLEELKLPKQSPQPQSGTNAKPKSSAN